MTKAGESPPKPVSFDEMPLSNEARIGLKALGYELATPVQASTFGPAMAGSDLVVQSKTGTGKTTAFGLPLIERVRVDTGLSDPQGLVLTPTRELALQVAEEVAELGDPKGIRVLTVYGGTPMQPQLSGLKAGCDVVVGTPGRVLDHIRRRTLRLVHVHLAVLDEADEMLSMGFWDEVTAILDQLPEARQTFLFSATLPDQIRRAAAKYLRDPERIDISRDELTVEGIENIAYERDDTLPKPRNLLYILEVEKPETAVIFCNTRDETHTVSSFLRRQGLNALALSGELGQKDRERIMGRMKRGDLQYLVATDIAARGIDISDLSHVINYSLPEFTEVYIHRVGRTGRIGKKGTAVSLVGGKDELTYSDLKRKFGIKFETRSLPDRQAIQKLHAARVAAELVKAARDVEITSFVPIASHLRESDGSTEAIAYLLRRYFAQVEDERERQAAEEDARIKRKQEEERNRRLQRAHAQHPTSDGEEKPKRKRRKRGEPKDSEKTEDIGAATDQVRLFVNRGNSHGFDDDKIKQLVIEVAGEGKTEDISSVQLRRTHAFVQVAPDLAERAVSASERGFELDDRPVTIERARTR